jgi:hypothetical protein
MLSMDEKILFLFNFVPPESKLWLVTKLHALAHFGSVIDKRAIHDAPTDKEIDDRHLLMLIGLLTPESKIWAAGKLFELVQIKNINDIIGVFDVASKEAAAFPLH